MDRVSRADQPRYLVFAIAFVAIDTLLIHGGEWQGGFQMNIGSMLYATTVDAILMILRLRSASLESVVDRFGFMMPCLDC